MNTPIFDRFRSGLFVLAVLTIAFIAGQAQPHTQELAATEDAFRLDADFRITIDQERLAHLESVASVIATVLDVPIRVELSIDETASPEMPDAGRVPAQ